MNTSLLPGRGVVLYDETLDIAEMLIQQTLALRSYAPLPQVEKSASALTRLFVHFTTYSPPSAQLEVRFLHLYAQEHNIRGLMYFENKKYKEALVTFEAMYELAKEANNTVLMVHALQKMGVELRRANRDQDAIDALEEARDLSFRTGKQVSAFANAYLGHIYAATGNAYRFEKAMHTAINIAEPLKGAYGDGTDFVHHKLSGILQLRSRGYLRLNQPKKTLELHEELKRQIDADSNLWLDHRLHLYKARAYVQLGDVESAVESGLDLFRDVKDWKSPHRMARAHELLEALEASSYGKLKIVRDFRAELMT